MAFLCATWFNSCLFLNLYISLKNNIFIKALTDVKSAEHFLHKLWRLKLKRKLRNNCHTFFFPESVNADKAYTVGHFCFYIKNLYILNVDTYTLLIKGVLFLQSLGRCHFTWKAVHSLWNIPTHFICTHTQKLCYQCIQVSIIYDSGTIWTLFSENNQHGHLAA